MSKAFNYKIIDKVWFAILIVCAFIFCIRLTGITYLEIDGLGKLMALLAIPGCIIKGRTKFDIGLIFLFVGLLLVGFLDFMNGSYYDVPYAWVLVLSYILGKQAVGNDKKNADKRVFIGYNTVAFGMAFLCILDLVYSPFTELYRTSFNDLDKIALLIRFWTGDTYSRSSASMLFTLTTGALYYAFIKRKESKLYLFYFWFLMIVNTAGSLELIRRESRSTVMFFVLLVFAVLFLKSCDKDKSSINIKRLKCVAVVIAVLLLTGLIFYKLDVFGIATAVRNSMWGRDGGILNNVRLYSAIAMFKAMPNCPYGGYAAGNVIPPHNVWLYYGDKYGVTVLGILSAFFICTVVDAFKMSFVKHDASNIKYLLVPGYFLLYMSYMTEGAAFSIRLYLCYGLFISGLIKGKLELEGNVKQDIKDISKKSKYCSE